MLEEMKLKDVMQLISLLKDGCKNENENYFWQVGKPYFIRTVTMYLIGKLSDLTEKELLLKDAVWVADSGRFHNALKTGELNEVEPFVSDVILNRECITDACEWLHKIPSEPK